MSLTWAAAVEHGEWRGREEAGGRCDGVCFYRMSRLCLSRLMLALQALGQVPSINISLASVVATVLGTGCQSG